MNALEALEKDHYKNVRLIKHANTKWAESSFFVRIYEAPTMLHRHEYIQINYVLRGSGRHFINSRDTDIAKGDILIIPPYLPHQISLRQSEKDSLTIVEFEFEPEFINENFKNSEEIDSFFDFEYIKPFFGEESQIEPRLHLVGKEQMEVERLLDEVVSEFERKEIGYKHLTKSLLLKLLIIIGRKLRSNRQGDIETFDYEQHRDNIVQSIEYIKNNYHKNLRLNTVAEKFCLSPSYFSYYFKGITGKTFIEYLNGYRITKAMEWLCNTGKRVIDISLDAGFNNVTHFNRVFKQITGNSPLEYRKASRNSNS